MTEPGTLYLDDDRYTQFLKPGTRGLEWRRLSIKHSASDAFRDIEDTTDESELWALAWSHRVVLDACREAIPDWADEFEDRFNERMTMMAGPMPKFTVRPAVRGIRNMIIGLAGEPGAGKTCSALRLAVGLAHGEPIVLIDSEYGAPTEFAPFDGELVPPTFDPIKPLFNFGVIDIEPPFTPDRYRLALHTAAQAKPRVLIIDNISDEHFAMCEMADACANKAHGQHWIEPKEQHKRFMQKCRTHPWYVILCVRTKEERMDDPSRGVVKGMIRPVCDASIPSDCRIFQLLHDGGIPNGFAGSPWKMPAALRSAIRTDRPLDEQTGEAIARWCQPIGDWREEV